jgi:hypothetical protein
MDGSRAAHEFQWISLMSRIKYDSYRDFTAGARFIERLVDWLQQFDQADREVAFGFVRRRLVYLSPMEMQHLVELMYPDHIRPLLLKAVAAALGVKPYQVLAHPEYPTLYKRFLRRTLFLGLSDGARMDTLRRNNVGLITNEQVVVGVQIDSDKWKSLLDDLRADLQENDATFQFVYLIDDFTGSGKTLLRYDDRSNKWKGKLAKFAQHIASIHGKPFDSVLQLHVHHHLASHQAVDANKREHEKAARELRITAFTSVQFSYGMVLPSNLPVLNGMGEDEFLRLCDQYYDSQVETKSTSVGGCDMRRGFAGGALPLVLEHNTPNNSLTLLWAETTGDSGRHPMRPLFRRRQRHVA